jgi:hypothetical protein
MRMSPPGPRGQANVAPWRRWPTCHVSGGTAPAVPVGGGLGY